MMEIKENILVFLSLCFIFIFSFSFHSFSDLGWKDLRNAYTTQLGIFQFQFQYQT